jgi:hypothetical protein
MERGGGGAFERERRKPGTGANDPWASWTRKGSERGGLGLKERKEGVRPALAGWAGLRKMNFRNRIVQVLWKLIIVCIKIIPNIIKYEPLV